MIKLPASIFWDPPREAFTLPFINFEIYWYSIFFALGFLGAYLITLYEFRLHLARTQNLPEDTLRKTAYAYVDRLTLYLFFGLLIGARLGHILFYDLSYFFKHPIEVFYIRQGGLASHGGAIGLLISFCLFWKKAKKTHLISWPHLLDILMVGVAFIAGCIRIGNFMNQEILGTPSQLPWAVTFGHPFEPAVMPCHPVQLYEAIFYFFVSALLFFLLHKFQKRFNWGMLTGLLFTLIFGFRFFIDFIKLPQESEPQGFLSMGQLLSLPFVAVGLYVIYKTIHHAHRH